MRRSTGIGISGLTPEGLKEYKKRYYQLYREEHLKRAKANRGERDPVVARNYAIRKKYGLDEREYKALLDKQGYRCAICGCGGTDILAFRVDHDHCTGKVRGLLCHNCNHALGLLDDDIEIVESLLRYLRKHSINLFEWPPMIIGEKKEIRLAKPRKDTITGATDFRGHSLATKVDPNEGMFD
jgi:hypothetical protein